MVSLIYDGNFMINYYIADFFGLYLPNFDCD